MATIPRVLAVGSCRISRPLRRLREDGEIDLVNFERHRWFTHTAAAALQYLNVLDGNTHIPAELRSAALETELDFPDAMSADLGPIDVAFVEVSTLKQHRVAGLELNAHKVYGAAAETGLPPAPIANGDTSGLPADHVLKGMKVTMAEEDSVAADLLAIRDRLGVPVILVDHLYSVLPDGSPVPERARLTKMLSRISETHDFGFYSTKDTILEHGTDAALADQNHYRPEFEPVVAGCFLPLIRRTLN